MIKKKVPTFNDGVVKLYIVDNIAEPGDRPKEALRLLCARRYHERTVGVHRYTALGQTGVRVDKVIRVPRVDVSIQEVAVLSDGKQYRIRQVQHPEDIAPPVTELSLELIKEAYLL